MAKTKKKRTKAKQTVGIVLHTHDEGSCTYVCKNGEIAWSVAAWLVYENMHEFDNAVEVVIGDKVMDEPTCLQAGVQCAKALIAGYYEEAVKLYNENVAGRYETIEVDPCVEVDDKMEEPPRADLETYIKRFEAILEERDDDGDEEGIQEGGHAGDTDGRVTEGQPDGVAAED